jgi:hypothetical protein
MWEWHKRGEGWFDGRFDSQAKPPSCRDVRPSRTPIYAPARGARICDKRGLSQSRNGKYQHFLAREVWYPALPVLLVLGLHLLLQRVLNLDRREQQDAKPTRVAAVIGADRFETPAARQQQDNLVNILLYEREDQGEGAKISMSWVLASGATIRGVPPLSGTNRNCTAGADST